MSAPVNGPRTNVSLITIADQLGVSRTTVSNAYNRPERLSPALRQRILDTALSLGYSGPHPVARSLRRKTAGAVGLIFSEALQYAFADPARGRILQGVATACEEAHSHLLLVSAGPEAVDRHLVLSALVDGFIFHCVAERHPLVSAALSRQLPCVSVDDRNITGVPWVGIDDRAAARDVAEHLLDLGHRDIAIVAYGLHAVPRVGVVPYSKQQRGAEFVSGARLAGYRDAFKAHGLDAETIPLYECGLNTVQDAAAACGVLLALDPRPTAFLCTSDQLAMGVLEASRAQHLRVPAELSVVGFDDIGQASRTTPPLTTISQPLVEKGLEATRLLLRGGPEHTSTILPYELIVRQTTGPPRSRC